MAKAKKLPSGNWRVLAHHNGVNKSFTAPTKKEAEYLALEWQNGFGRQLKNDMTVYDAEKKYIAAKSSVLSPYTIHSYKIIANNGLNLHGVKLSNLTNEVVQVAINELSAIRSPKTVRNAFALLSSTLKMYCPNLRITITLPKPVKNDIILPTEDEIKKMVQCSFGTDIYIPILLASFCGMREGEICALESFDITDNKINVNKSMVKDDEKGWTTKSPKSLSGYRIIDMPQFVSEALKGIDGRIVDMKPYIVLKHFKKLLKDNNIRDMRFHDLRHFYISQLFDIGMPEKYIISQVGHSSATITKRVYDHISAKKQTDYSKKISMYFNSFNTNSTRCF